MSVNNTGWKKTIQIIKIDKNRKKISKWKKKLESSVYEIFLRLNLKKNADKWRWCTLKKDKKGPYKNELVSPQRTVNFGVNEMDFSCIHLD